MKSKFLPIVVVLVAAVALVVAACGSPVDAGGGTPSNTAAVTYAQPATGDIPPTISVSGSGTASAAPDVAYVQLGVETINTNAATAVSENTKKMQAVMAALAEAGIAESDIQTVGYSMWIEQIYDKDGQPTNEVRYHVSNQIRITVHDLDTTGNVLQVALEAGANTVGGVTFAVEDTTALQEQARNAAIANAQAKAEQLANGFGVKLGALHSASEFSAVPVPAPAYDMAAGVGGGIHAPRPAL